MGLKGSQWKLRQQHDQSFLIEQMLGLKENNSHSHSKGVSQSGLQVGKLVIWVSSFGVEKLYESSPGPSVPPE